MPATTSVGNAKVVKFEVIEETGEIKILLTRLGRWERLDVTETDEQLVRCLVWLPLVLRSANFFLMSLATDGVAPVIACIKSPVFSDAATESA